MCRWYYIRPQTQGGRAFLVIYALVGLGVMAAAITTIGMSKYEIYCIYIIIYQAKWLWLEQTNKKMISFEPAKSLRKNLGN